MRKKSRNKKNRSFARASVIALVIVSFLGFLIGLIVNHPEFIARQDNRGKASVPGGKTSFLITPAIGPLLPNEPTTLNISAFLPVGLDIDGLQAVLTITGSIPVDVVFEPHVPAGLSLFSVVSGPQVSGWNLKFAYTETNMGIPYSGQGLISLGNLRFTAPVSGMMTVSFDPIYSKVMENGISADVLNTPPSYDYLILGPSPLPTAIVSTTPTPTPNEHAAPTKKPKEKNVTSNSAINKLDTDK